MNLDTRLLIRDIRKLELRLSTARGELKAIQDSCAHDWETLYEDDVLFGKIYVGKLCKGCGKRI